MSTSEPPKDAQPGTNADGESLASETSEDNLAILAATAAQYAIRIKSGEDAAFRDIFSKFARRRKEVIHQSFFLDGKAIQELHDIVVERVSALSGQSSARFEAVLRLEDRHEVIFSDAAELAKWKDPERSRPRRLTLGWQYLYLPEKAPLTSPLPYDVVIDFELHPDVDHPGLVDVEEEIILHFEGPTTEFVRDLNERVAVLLDTIQLAWWWRHFKRTVIFLKPYLGHGLISVFTFGGSVAAFVYAQHDTQRRTEQAIRETQLVETKIEILVHYLMHPVEWNKYLLALTVFLPIVGGLALGLSRFLAFLYPPSIIAIGVYAKSAEQRLAAYNWIGGFLLAAVLTALGSVLWAAAFSD